MNEIKLRKQAIEKMKKYYKNAARLFIQTIKTYVFTKTGKENK